MKQDLREVVRLMVEQLLDEATYRKDYVEGIYNVLYGALGEYYKARYAEANACATQQDIDHWDKEVTNHLDSEFVRCVRRKEKGFKRMPAFKEALADLHDDVPFLLKWAKNQIVKKCRVADPRVMVDPSDESTDEFFARLENEFNACFTV